MTYKWACVEFRGRKMKRDKIHRFQRLDAAQAVYLKLESIGKLSFVVPYPKVNAK